MISGAKTLVCMMGVWALCRAADAAAPGAESNPYQGIVDRNVFGLKPPPPPPDPEANKPPPPKIFLTGITTILGNKRALLKTTPPAKPGEPAKEQTFTIGEGQRDGDIEVLEINEKAGTVKVNDYGTITTLDFDKDGVKAVVGAAPAAARPAGFVPAPGANPFMPAGGANTLPRPMRLPAPAGTSATPSAYNTAPVTPAYGSPSATAGAVTLPGVNFGASHTQPGAQPQLPPVSGETQTALLAAQQLANKDKLYPPAPPPISQLLGEQNNSGSATTPGAHSPPQLPRAPSLPPLPQ